MTFTIVTIYRKLEPMPYGSLLVTRSPILKPEKQRSHVAIDIRKKSGQMKCLRISVSNQVGVEDL